MPIQSKLMHHSTSPDENNCGHSWYRYRAHFSEDQLRRTVILNKPEPYGFLLPFRYPTNNLRTERKMPRLRHESVTYLCSCMNVLDRLGRKTVAVCMAIALSVSTETYIGNSARAAGPDDGAKNVVPEMVTIPAGRFQMGCVSGLECDDDEMPVHDVKIESFKLSKYEVTFEEYDRFAVATNRTLPPDGGWGRGRRPVVKVSWSDAVAYTQWLSQVTGDLYWLPSEAEWEYAARAGRSMKYSWGNGISRNRAVCNGCTSRWDNTQTAPVGSFRPNAWGLHDMHGNVWEWARDCWNPSYSGAPSDGSPWMTGDCSKHAVRGGAWDKLPRSLRAANRYGQPSGSSSFSIGFRVAGEAVP